MAKIQIKRGLEEDLPILDIGELAWTRDSKKLFIGTVHGNERINNIGDSAGGSVEIVESTINGKILINGNPLNVYNDADILSSIQQLTINKSEVVPSVNNGSIIINNTEVQIYDDADLRNQMPSNPETLTKLTDNGTTLFFNGSPLGGSGGSTVAEPEFIVKESWSTTGTRNFSTDMTKFFIHNTGASDLSFTIHDITITVKATEKFEAIFDSFTSVSVTTTDTFEANVSSLKVGSANTLYSIKDHRSGSSDQTFTLPSTRYGLVVSNDGSSTLSYTVNGITIAVGAGDVVEKLFDGFTQIQVASTVPYRLLTKDGFVSSDNGVDLTPPTVTATPNGGSFSSAQSVALTANETATIYYTTDGSTPTTSSTAYTSPISISVNTTLKFFGVDSANNTSAVQTVNFVIDTVSPTTTISPVAGTYGESQTITLTTNETATVYYTLDGSNPTTSSTVYTSPITINNTTTINYFARDSVGNNETIKTAVFTINLPDTAPPVITASPSGGTYMASQSITLTSNEAATIYYTVDGSNPTTSSTAYTAPIEVTVTTTLKYIGVDASNNTSSIQTSVYTISLPDTTAPEPVTGLTVGTPTSNTVPISWTLSTSQDVASYEVAYSIDGTNFTVANASVLANSNSYTVTGLTASTLYTLRVVAVDGAGNRSVAVTTTATTATASGSGSYVNDASLKLYLENPTNGSITNPTEYFAGVDQWGFSMTVTSQPYTHLLGRERESVGGTYRLRIRNENNQLSVVILGQNTANGNADAWFQLTPSATTALIVGTNNHISLQRDATHLRLRINNVEVWSIPIAATISLDASGLKPLTIGGNSGEGIPSVIKNVNYYTRALSDEELTQNYNALK